jgi:hypothetical protein
MTRDTANWSGEGTFTQLLLDRLDAIDAIEFVRVEDAPASRSEADYNFISNELFVRFVVTERETTEKKFGILPVKRTVFDKQMTIAALGEALGQIEDIGAPDYTDDGMLQFLRAERIVPPYQTRGYKLVELVRVYEVGSERASAT